jgi:ATP-dependent protease ClpP protease subunit
MLGRTMTFLSTIAARSIFGAMFSFALASVGLPNCATAATIDAYPPLPTTPSVSSIGIVGEIVPGDFERFKTAAATISPTNTVVVFLASDGGNLIEGLEIGEQIRKLRYATAVPDGFRCASACALAWLAGTPRPMMGPTALVGFHAASNVVDGSESGQANALVGAYLIKLNLDYAAVAYVTGAKPNDMRWLTPDDAGRVGIAVEIVQPVKQVNYASAVPSPAAPTFGHMTFPLIRDGLQGSLFDWSGQDTDAASMHGWITAANVVDFCNRTRSQSSPVYDRCFKVQTNAIGAEIASTANCMTGLVSYSIRGDVKASMIAPSGETAVAEGFDPMQSRTMLLDQFKLMCPAAARTARLGG